MTSSDLIEREITRTVDGTHLSARQKVLQWLEQLSEALANFLIKAHLEGKHMSE